MLIFKAFEVQKPKEYESKDTSFSRKEKKIIMR